jgi:hypothetical protein
MTEGIIKDPHVFPYVVKGMNADLLIRYESRRSAVEAQQSVDRFKSEGYRAWLFKFQELGEQ